MCALSKHPVQPFLCPVSSDVTEFSLEESFAFPRRGETGSGKLMTLAQSYPDGKQQSWDLRLKPAQCDFLAAYQGQEPPSS